MNSLEFFIYKYSISNGANIDLSSIPMMLRRKLSPVGKIAMHTMLDCYSGGEPELVYASRYGELERMLKLINQQKEENEISPAGFSFSVHNSTVGLFSLINKIHSGYNSIAACKNTLSNALLASVMARKEVLFCYAESVDRYESCSVLLGVEPKKEALKVVCTDNCQNLEENSFFDFLEGKVDYYACPIYVLRRADG